MIDNIEQIKRLLNFIDEGDFYMLYVFKRKKDLWNVINKKLECYGSKRDNLRSV